MVVIVLLLLALWTTYQGSSQASWRTNNAISKNNITLRNAYWHDNTRRILDHHQDQTSKVIQYYNYDKIIQQQRFNNHYFHNHTKEKKSNVEHKLVSRQHMHAKTNSSNNINNNNSGNKIIEFN